MHIDVALLHLLEAGPKTPQLSCLFECLEMTIQCLTDLHLALRGAENIKKSVEILAFYL